jgi:hypothetical protein
MERVDTQVSDQYAFFNKKGGTTWELDYTTQNTRGSSLKSNAYTQTVNPPIAGFSPKMSIAQESSSTLASLDAVSPTIQWVKYQTNEYLEYLVYIDGPIQVSGEVRVQLVSVFEAFQGSIDFTKGVIIELLCSVSKPVWTSVPVVKIIQHNSGRKIISYAVDCLFNVLADKLVYPRFTMRFSVNWNTAGGVDNVFTHFYNLAYQNYAYQLGRFLLPIKPIYSQDNEHSSYSGACCLKPLKKKNPLLKRFKSYVSCVSHQKE